MITPHQQQKNITSSIFNAFQVLGYMPTDSEYKDICFQYLDLFCGHLTLNVCREAQAAAKVKLNNYWFKIEQNKLSSKLATQESAPEEDAPETAASEGTDEATDEPTYN